MNNIEFTKLIGEINKIRKNNKYDIVEFSLSTGGIPRILDEKLKKDVCTSDMQFNYEVSSGDKAYSGYVKIRCKKTNFVDREGNEIYITPNFIFIEEYQEGSPSCFDDSYLITPYIYINNKFVDINKRI